MPTVPIDVAGAGVIPAGDYEAFISGVKYQVKIGEKWNNEGMKEVSFEEWMQFDDEVRRLQYTLTIPSLAGRAIMANESTFYLKTNALGFLKSFLKKAGVELVRGNFDPEAPLGCIIGTTVAVEDDAVYGERNKITKFYKV